MFFKQKRKALDPALLNKIKEYLNLHMSPAAKIEEAPWQEPGPAPRVEETARPLYSAFKPAPKAGGMAAPMQPMQNMEPPQEDSYLPPDSFELLTNEPPFDSPEAFEPDSKFLSKIDAALLHLEEASSKPSASAPSLSDLLKDMGKTFGEALMEEADRIGISDAALYRKAQVSRATFHKIIRGQSVPGRQIACALVLALELPEHEAEELLGRAGIHLADNNPFDLILRYCLENGIYDIDRVNDILYEFDQLLVGSAK